MATSQNGWPVIESGTDPRLVAIPKIAGRVRVGEVAQIFTYLVTRFDAEVEDVDRGADEWGHAYRAIRGATTYSNHASGTAIDLNATQHPLGAVGTFTTAQVAAIRRILADLGGVVRWGGDYSGRKDEMHFEINRGPGAVLVSRQLTLPSGGITVPELAAPTPLPRTPEDSTMRIISAPLPWDTTKRQQVYVTDSGGAGTLTDAEAAILRQNWPSHDYASWNDVETEVRLAWARHATANGSDLTSSQVQADVEAAVRRVLGALDGKA
ncbi:M15 family metallopeptidase [Cellulomonas endometrii]|uniref:M15 family metallopeptidase n=1 Tax=Cellulomonas endometrii TaxID=3036301 RepID=UPI0024AE0342|nr:M15 family metallopeptidase [Cellulomonas endometrii]